MNLAYTYLRLASSLATSKKGWASCPRGGYRISTETILIAYGLPRKTEWNPSVHTRGSPPPACSFRGQVRATSAHHSGPVGPYICVCDCVWARLVRAVSLPLSFQVCICAVQYLSVNIEMCPDDLRVWK